MPDVLIRDKQQQTNNCCNMESAAVSSLVFTYRVETEES